MNPLSRASFRYFSIANLSGTEREKSLPWGGQGPGISSIAQSYDPWGGGVGSVWQLGLYRRLRGGPCILGELRMAREGEVGAY